MGANFSSNQLSGAVTNGIPATSYAYSSGNTKLFGVAATYSFNNQGQNLPASATPIGEITPYLINSASPTLACLPFQINNRGNSVRCPVTGASLASGQYTLSFSQYTTTTSIGNGGTYLVKSADGTRSNTLANYGGAVTFSIVPQQAAGPATTTITPTLTVSTTITSGISTILPTTTIVVPSSIQTVTVYQTTIISTSTQLSTLSGASLVTVTASCPTTTTSTSKATTTLLKCNQDNCLRAFIGRSASASAFCSQYTKGQVTATPTYASQCAGLTSRVSSACSCLVQPTRAAVIKERGGAVELHGPPNFTYSGNAAVVTVTVTAGPVATDVSGPVPSSTLTNPDATASSGTLTLTSNFVSTVTTTVLQSTVDQRTASTVTVQPTTCGLTSTV
ncbi:hypothetical protein VTL71DRAFT_9675 [Oculimacula yallundae]|uniref:Uncharacterized protein n=1 Tax=Oculimacula yallundae TaxID=86028 RepID=A0ABR4BRJ3_9HELO